MKLETSSLTIYVKNNARPDPDVPSSYDFSAVGYFTFSDYAVIADWTGHTAFYAIKNTTASAVSFTLRQLVSTKDTLGVYHGDGPTFFATNGDGRPLPELFSYTTPYNDSCYSRFDGGFHYRHLCVPPQGYCVYEVIVRRSGVSNASGISIAPSTGAAALAVSVGLMLGTTDAVAGTFTELVSITIPAGAAEARQSVFWPVVRGASLAYQCAEAVQVFPMVNFQPWACSTLVPPDEPNDPDARFSGDPYFPGSNSPYFTTSKPLLKFTNLFAPQSLSVTTEKIVLPVHSAIYNDMEAVLNLLP